MMNDSGEAPNILDDHDPHEHHQHSHPSHVHPHAHHEDEEPVPEVESTEDYDIRAIRSKEGLDWALQQPMIRTRVEAAILPPHLFDLFQQGAYSKAPVFAGTTAPGGGGFWTCAACGRTTQYTLTKHLGYSIKPTQALCPWLRLYHHDMFKLLKKPRAAHGTRQRHPGSMMLGGIPVSSLTGPSPKRSHLDLGPVSAPTAAQMPYEGQPEPDARSDDVGYFHSAQQEPHDGTQVDQSPAVLNSTAPSSVSLNAETHPTDPRQQLLAKCEGQLQRLHTIQSNLHYQLKVIEQQVSEANIAITQAREEFQRLKSIS